MAYTEADLTAVEAAIRARLDGGAVDSYAIEGRSLKYVSLAELRELRDEILTELSHAAGGARTYGSRRRPM